MSTGLGLGVVVGSVNSVSAVDPYGSGAADGSDYDIVSRSTSLRLAPGEVPVLGRATVSAAGRHSRAIQLDGFAGRVGDPVGILAPDGATYSGEDLMATAIGCLADEASLELDASPTIVAAYPTAWPRYTVDALSDALERAGLSDVTPVPEATASMRWLENARGPLGDGAVVVYDLGGSSLDVTVMRTGDDAGILGKPLRSEDIAGAQFDHLTMQYVLANAGVAEGLDLFDPETETALTAVREQCAHAKEVLSQDTETALPVELPGTYREVRLVRGELEDLLRAPLLTSIELVREAVHAAGLEVTDISQVLLTGGGASIPLVAELISSELGLPVVAAAEPRLTAAIGAAMMATELGAATDALKDRAATPVAALGTASAAAASTGTAVERVSRALPVLPVAEPEKQTMARGKKIGIVVTAAAAITLLAAGGLSLGTGGGLTGNSNQTVSTSQNSSAATPSGVPAASGSAATTPGSVAGVASTAAGTTSAAGVPGGSANSVGSAATPGAPAAGAPGTTAAGAPAPAAPGQPQNQAPAPAQNPAPPAPPAYTPPPQEAPSPPAEPVGPAPTNTYNPGNGGGVGGVVNGVGNGVGGVVNGVGNGVGGVLGGLTGGH